MGGPDSNWTDNGFCDDGGQEQIGHSRAAAVPGSCALGTDCGDCGPRLISDPCSSSPCAAGGEILMSSWEGMTEIPLRFHHLTWPYLPHQAAAQPVAVAALHASASRAGQVSCVSWTCAPPRPARTTGSAPCSRQQGVVHSSAARARLAGLAAPARPALWSVAAVTQLSRPAPQSPPPSRPQRRSRSQSKRHTRARWCHHRLRRQRVAVTSTPAVPQ
eukprot:COSAG01_NODE_240_length_20656_cov_53.398259_26_plen_217_part_00